MPRPIATFPLLRRTLAAITLTGCLVTAATPTGLSPAWADEQSADDSLQAQFTAAAREFGVPESVLLAVSYNLSRWEQHAGRPSTTAGYGPMHLTELETDPYEPSLHTLEAAAALLHLPPDRLKQETAQNIRGAAALLARYAKETTGRLPAREADWYGAVAKYSGSTDADAALSFADQVYTTINTGAERQTNDAQHVMLSSKHVRPNLATLFKLKLKRSKATGGADCPESLTCRFIPAFYDKNQGVYGYGNLDTADRVTGGDAMPSIDYIILHDTEGAYDKSITWFQNPTANASAHYVIRSADGAVTQMVDAKAAAWHAGNWFFNTHSIGIEHEGYALAGAAWYNERLYQASAKLVRYLAEKYKIPKDRAHIMGHDEIPGTSVETQGRMHWDPGPYWDWAHFMALVGAPILPDSGPQGDRIVTIRPAFHQNRQPVKGAPLQAANFLYLYQQPSLAGALLDDPVLPGGGTRAASDWGDKVRIGQSYALAERQGEWTAIWYGGQKAWFHDPRGDRTVPGRGTLVRPRLGQDTIPVYGTAYPEPRVFPIGIPVPELTLIGYTIPFGQVYVATERIPGRYYHVAGYAPDPAVHQYIVGTEQYYRIQFNHRYAFVKASDVEVVE